MTTPIDELALGAAASEIGAAVLRGLRHSGGRLDAQEMAAAEAAFLSSLGLNRFIDLCFWDHCFAIPDPEEGVRIYPSRRDGHGWVTVDQPRIARPAEPALIGAIVRDFVQSPLEPFVEEPSHT